MYEKTKKVIVTTKSEFVLSTVWWHGIAPMLVLVLFPFINFMEIENPFIRCLIIIVLIIYALTNLVRVVGRMLSIVSPSLFHYTEFGYSFEIKD